MNRIYIFVIRLFEIPLAIKARLQKQLFKKCGYNVYIGYNCELFYCCGKPCKSYR